MSLKVIHLDGAVRPRTLGQPVAEAASMPRQCPACGPLPPCATSRYCARHLSQLRATWLAGRSDAGARPPSEPDKRGEIEMDITPAASAPALRRLFLARLERCARLATSADPREARAWSGLARRATLSTYRDCVALGVEAEARDILGRALSQRSAA